MATQPENAHELEVIADRITWPQIEPIATTVSQSPKPASRSAAIIAHLRSWLADGYLQGWQRAFGDVRWPIDVVAKSLHSSAQSSEVAQNHDTKGAFLIFVTLLSIQTDASEHWAGNVE